jgi:hypothetical protein
MPIKDKIINSEYNIINTKINETQTLEWNQDLGIGFLNPDPNQVDVYDADYWNKYRKLIDTEIGRNLTKARIDMVKSLGIGPLATLDVGIGNGQFVDTFGCYGFDINPHAVEYLKKKNKLVDPYSENYKWKCITLWDVIEHIVCPTELLSKSDIFALSTPIYKNMEDCLVSKHFRPTEHFWYFTVSGMISYMNQFGFECTYYSTIESQLGRESIGSFIFKKHLTK